MGILRSSNVEFYANDPQIGRYFSPSFLQHGGMNFPVIVSLGTTAIKIPGAAPGPTPTVMAHLDTGATATTIDINLARHMGLTSVGTAGLRTAGGPVKSPTFVIDLQFPHSNLSPFIDLPVCSCDMSFDLNKPINAPGNFGMLIGRDVMSRWNIAWNGPTSTVIIND